jgi:para-nitrobenzyl esterase
MKKISFLFLTIFLSACAIDTTKKENLEETKLISSFSDKYVGIELNNSYQWLGIPYAEPPQGSLRWKAPRALINQKEAVKALKFSDSCPQVPSISLDRGGKGNYTGSEDCLYLNVFTPKKISSNKKLPVMFWIHGGGNTSGEAASYDFSKLASTHELVIVSINYRLGFLGWFYHPSFAATSNNLEDKSGNFGTLDQIMALKWVKQNIEDFGGDKNNVTIFGESAGGHNVFALLSSPLAKGLFHKAISQSGATNTFTLKEASKFFDDKESSFLTSSKEVVSKLLVSSESSKDLFEANIAQDSMNEFKLLELMQGLDLDLIFKVYKVIDKSKQVGKKMIPRVLSDGHVIPKRGMQFSRKSFYNDVPVIFGTNRDETKLFAAMESDYSTSLFNRLIVIRNQEMYDLTAEYASNNWKISAVDNPARDMIASGKKDVFAYRFDWDEQGKLLWMDFSKIFGAAHAMEIPFVTGTMKLLGIERFMFNDDNLPDAIRLSIAMQSYWAEFAYTGDPDKGRDNNLPKWNSWSSSGEKFLILDSQNDQGIIMSNFELKRIDEFKRLYADSRIKKDKTKCKFLTNLVQNAYEKDAISFYNKKCLQGE